MNIEYVVTINRAHFEQKIFSEGTVVLPDGRGRCTPETYVVTWLPWFVQVQEKGPDGAWQLVHESSYWRRADAEAAAERMGMTVDHVAHYTDQFRVIHLG